ncbi:MAG TPA: CGNR zinc finger domain-containing protein [Gaiellaceae bacterium]|nr:CGNR zinc finger domain-containing protein [Gaiellaceae bacterium]
MPDSFQPGGRAPAPAPLRLVQDFVNTEIPEWARDDVGTPGALAAWLQARGLLTEDSGVAAEVFVAARALRSALRELALANTLGTPLPVARRDEVDAALGAFTLAVRVPEGAPRLVPTAAGATGALAVIVAVVAEARATGAWERLKACRHETCGWVFWDGSRNRSSSWCSMQVCGGRAKARSYRRRHAGRSGVR